MLELNYKPTPEEVLQLLGVYDKSRDLLLNVTFLSSQANISERDFLASLSYHYQIMRIDGNLWATVNPAKKYMQQDPAIAEARKLTLMGSGFESDTKFFAIFRNTTDHERIKFSLKSIEVDGVFLEIISQEPVTLDPGFEDALEVIVSPKPFETLRGRMYNATYYKFTIIE